MEALIFQLYGPLASWGAPAVGETRPSSDHPGRAALLGLLANRFGCLLGVIQIGANYVGVNAKGCAIGGGLSGLRLTMVIVQQ